MTDLIIIGGGPAGCAAGVYAARKQIKTLLFAESFGGQSVVSNDIQNWIGTITLSGEQLAQSLKKHLEAYANNVVMIHEKRVQEITRENNNFTVTADNVAYQTRAILIATGSHHRKLEVPGADIFEHKGLTYCASCDGPLFSGKDLVVLGGGNAAFETAAQLLAYAKSVTLIHRGNDFFRADSITVEKILSHPHMRAIKNSEILEIKGDSFVTSITYKNKEIGEVIDLPTGGIFIEIGQLPNTDFVKDIVTLNKWGHIVIDPRTQQTTTKMIWAAGDCTDVLYHQNNIAAGDAVRAIEDIYQHLYAK